MARDDFSAAVNAALTLVNNDPETRAAARRYLDKHAPDLIDAFGLGDPAEPGVALGPSGVPCPQCQVAAGTRCVSVNGAEVSFHRARIRKALQGSEEEAA